MIVNAKLTGYEVEALIRTHLEEKFKALLSRDGGDYLEVTFPKRLEPVEAQCEAKRNPIDPRD